MSWRSIAFRRESRQSARDNLFDMSNHVPEVQIADGAGGNDATGIGDDDTHSNHSDEALEVVFDEQNPFRRKSSMVSENRHRLADASCYVHSLLESQKRQSRHADDPNIEKTEHAKAVETKCLDGKGVSHPDQTAESSDGQNDKRGNVNHAVAATTTHSRLLTKKQLSDMAWGVRELSKHLGAMRLKPKVRTVFLLTKTYDVDLIGNTRDVVKFLLGPGQDHTYTVYVENKFEKNERFDAPGLLKDISSPSAVEGAAKRLKYWNHEMCKKRPHTFDFVVTLGGDGTVLYASWLFQQIVPPVLSFGLGSLGFLTTFDYSDYQGILTRAFREGITVSLRLRFECTVMRSVSVKGENGKEKTQEDRDIVEELVGRECGNNNTHRPDGTYLILNDVVVDRGPNGTMSSTELFGDDEHFTNIQADGVCVATPTGSTAYNLAAGGSLCHPENPVMLVTAIAAHTLSFRPIILPDTIVLRVAVPYNARSTCWASFDGRERVELQFGDYVSISASRYPFATIMNTKLGGKRSEDWVRSISGKLGWNTREKPKSYKGWE